MPSQLLVLCYDLSSYVTCARQIPTNRDVRLPNLVEQSRTDPFDLHTHDPLLQAQFTNTHHVALRVLKGLEWGIPFRRVT
jgi:hypothetical protein